jgi:hypothetical protein
MKIVEIALTCWEGSIGGEHYNAKMYCDNERIDEVTYKINKAQARMFNDKDETKGWGGGFFRWKAGDETERFWSKEDAVNRCVELALQKWQNVGLIVVGSDCNPSEPAWCYDEKVKQKLYDLWLDAESLYKQVCDPFEYFPDETKQIWGEWDKIINQIKNVDNPKDSATIEPK